MIQCPICQVMNDESALFCAECGQRFTKADPLQRQQQPQHEEAPPAPLPLEQESRPKKVKLHSPILGGADEDEPEGYDKPQMSRLRGTASRQKDDDRSPSRKLRSPMLGGGDNDMDDEPDEGPTIRPARPKKKGGLRSPLLGVDDETEPPAPPSGQGGGGKKKRLRSPLLGEDDLDDEEQPQSRRRSSTLGGQEGNKPAARQSSGGLRSPLLSGGGEYYDNDDDEPVENAKAGRPAGARKETYSSGKHRLRSPILGSSDDDEYDDNRDDEDIDNPNVLRSPLLAAKTRTHDMVKPQEEERARTSGVFGAGQDTPPGVQVHRQPQVDQGTGGAGSVQSYVDDGRANPMMQPPGSGPAPPVGMPGSAPEMLGGPGALIPPSGGPQTDPGMGIPGGPGIQMPPAPPTDPFLSILGPQGAPGNYSSAPAGSPAGSPFPGPAQPSPWPADQSEQYPGGNQAVGNQVSPQAEIPMPAPGFRPPLPGSMPMPMPLGPGTMPDSPGSMQPAENARAENARAQGQMQPQPAPDQAPEAPMPPLPGAMPGLLPPTLTPPAIPSPNVPPAPLEVSIMGPPEGQGGFISAPELGTSGPALGREDTGSMRREDTSSPRRDETGSSAQIEDAVSHRADGISPRRRGDIGMGKRAYDADFSPPAERSGERHSSLLTDDESDSFGPQDRRRVDRRRGDRRLGVSKLLDGGSSPAPGLDDDFSPPAQTNGLAVIMIGLAVLAILAKGWVLYQMATMWDLSKIGFVFVDQTFSIFAILGLIVLALSCMKK